MLETSLVSAFVSFGVAAAVLHASEPSPVTVTGCESQDALAPLLRMAVEADAAFSSPGHTIEAAEAARVEALYAWFVGEHEKLAATSTTEWAQARAEGLRQLQKDMEEMKELEKQAMALQALENAAE